MRLLTILYVVLLGIVVVSQAQWFSQQYGSNTNTNQQQAILLRDVQTLTLRKGRQTEARRVSPIPQLSCIGGSAQHLSKYQPDVVQCKNVGIDSIGNIQWDCTADLDEDVKFGEVTVSCEGYSYPGDPYILPGSCGLKYRLDLTEKGQERQSGSHYRTSHHHQGANSYSFGSPTSTNGSSSASSFWEIVMFVVVAVIIVSMLGQCAAPNRNNQSPPPTPNGANYGTNTYGTSYPSMGPSYSTGTVPPQTGGGGFWSGLATGGLLSYLFAPRRRFGWGGGGWGYGPTYGPSYGYAPTYGPSYGAAPSYSYPTTSSTSYSSHSSPSPSTTRRAHGYGGTESR